MIIDFHVHPRFLDPQQGIPTGSDLPKKLDIVANPKQFGLAAGQTAHRYYQRGPVIMSLSEFIRQMDESKIDKAVLGNPAIKGTPVRASNENVSNLVKKYPERLIGFAGFDPNNAEEAVLEIEYATKQLGFRGVKTVASMVELDINDKAFYPCYAKAQELGIPVLIHTGSAMIKGVRTKHVLPLMVDDVAFDFPDLKIICAHLGGWQYLDVVSMLIHHPNVYADISFWPLNPLFVNLVPWSLLEQTVPDKILFGSDYPAGQTPREAAEAVRRLPVSDGFKERILGANAAKILGL